MQKEVIMRKILNKIICFVLIFAFSLSVLVGCAPAPQKIKVQFMSEGAIYKTIDAETGKEIELPAEPVSQSGQFLGWYLDNGVWSKPFVEDTLVDIGVLDETTLNVYAKFGPANIVSGKSAIEYARYNMAGEDALGRVVHPAHGDRYDIDVGVFYCMWNGGGSTHPGLQTEILDIQDMIENGQTDLLTNGDNLGQFHYWGEPLYGYYRSEDKWVLMRHMELLSQADVDFICIDNTNPVIYVEATLALLETLLELHNAGYQEVLPKVTFYTNDNSGAQIEKIKSEFYMYQNEKFAPLWYSPNGKPLIIGTTTNNIGSNVHFSTSITKSLFDAEGQDYFDVKESQWPNARDEDPNAIPWTHWSKLIGDNGPTEAGYMAIPVAQHAQVYDSSIGNYNINASSMSKEASRGYSPKNDTKDDVASGTSFKESWSDVYYFAERGTLKGVLVTGWNEWIAQKQAGGVFVDVYNNEFSRDMEMMVDDATTTSVGYGDNFYMQLVQQVRDVKYKLHNGGNVVSLPSRTIDIYDTNYAISWAGANATYRDFKGDALARNCQNAANGGTTQATYVDNTNRNDIKTIRVAHDSQYLYMYVDCATTITPYQAGDTAWMNVLIGTQYGEGTFGGYSYMINRKPTANSNTTSVHTYVNGEWVQTGTAEYNLNGEVITFRISLAAIGGSPSIRFKVSDNVQRDSRFNHNPIMNYYITGDSAPLGRLGYTYNF